ncbi:MAG: membrane protein insertion efficiency factor YidD [Planctomycetaceae bacterium]
MKPLRLLYAIPSLVLILLVRFYQRFISWMFGNCCRFAPSCSAYFIQAVEKYGAIRGSLRGLLRICRCHPFHPGGYDPP